MLSLTSPGFSKAAFLSDMAVANFRKCPSGRPNSFKSFSVSIIRASRSIFSSWNFAMCSSRPQAARNLSNAPLAPSLSLDSVSEININNFFGESVTFPYMTNRLRSCFYSSSRLSSRRNRWSIPRHLSSRTRLPSVSKRLACSLSIFYKKCTLNNERLIFIAHRPKSYAPNSGPVEYACRFLKHDVSA